MTGPPVVPLLLGLCILRAVACGGAGGAGGGGGGGEGAGGGEAGAVRPAVVEVGEGRYRLGAVTIDKRERSLSFPAVINMDRELVEYFCVTERGRTHEAVLVTALVPQHLHLAMLLLAGDGVVPSPVEGDFNYTQDLPEGLPVGLSVSWERGGERVELPASRLVTHIVRKSSPADDTWIYTGGRIYEGQFVADLQGDIIAIMENVDSLVNIRDEDRATDEPWRAAEGTVPQVGTPVVVKLSLGEAAADGEEGD